MVYENALSFEVTKEGGYPDFKCHQTQLSQMAHGSELHGNGDNGITGLSAVIHSNGNKADGNTAGMELTTAGMGSVVCGNTTVIIIA